MSGMKGTAYTKDETGRWFPKPDLAEYDPASFGFADGWTESMIVGFLQDRETDVYLSYWQGNPTDHTFCPGCGAECIYTDTSGDTIDWEQEHEPDCRYVEWTNEEEGGWCVTCQKQLAVAAVHDFSDFDGARRTGYTLSCGHSFIDAPCPDGCPMTNGEHSWNCQTMWDERNGMDDTGEGE